MSIFIYQQQKIMSKFGSDPKVKKSFVRNCEQKLKPSTRKQVIRDVGCSSKAVFSSRSSSKENELIEPTLCSSEALASYLYDIKNAAPPLLTKDDLNIDKSQISSKMTKKLNFHFDDKVYRNLIELNANVENIKTKKDKRPLSNSSAKKDQEPNIDDVYEDIIERDSSLNVPVIKPKNKPVKKIENGSLHKLVAAFEHL